MQALTPNGEALVAVGDRLQLRAGRLRAVGPDDQALSNAIAAILTLPLDAALRERTVALGAGAAIGEPLVLDVLPLAQEFWSFGFRPRVLVVARNFQSVREATSALLIQAFGLTKAEADVAEQISRGVSREEIAENRHASLGTVRGQLKSIFRKLGVAREGELIARISALR